MTEDSAWGAVDPGWGPRPGVAVPSTADAIVIGLGGTGLTAITRLVDAGLTVVGIDRGPVAGGAAGRNGGFLLAGIAAFHHDAVERYGRRAAAGWYAQTLAVLDDTFDDPALGATRCGSLRAAADEEELEDCRAHLAALLADGFPAEWHEGPDGRGVLLRCDGSFDPVRRSRVLAGRARRAGATLVTGVTVTDVQDGRVTTEAGVVTARHVVIAVDGGLEWLLPELTGEVRSTRLQMLGTAPVAERVRSRPVYERYGLDYSQQLADGRVVLGGGRDVGGPGEWLSPGEEARTTPPVQQHLDGLLAAMAGRGTRVTHRWAAAVAMTDSGLPVVRRVRGDAWAIGAYNGTGNIVGPALAAAVAERLVTGQSAALAPWLAP